MSNMKIIRPKRKELDMDVTPLIDVVFQLLVFFMLTSSFLLPGIELSLPKAITYDDLNQDLILSISSEGKYFIGNESIGETELMEKLKEEISARKEKSVTIRSDQSVAYRYFLKAMDAARQANASTINLLHEKP